MRQTGDNIGEGSGKLHLSLRRDQKMQTRGADQHPGQKFTKDCWELKPHQHLRQGASSNKDQHEAQNADQSFC